MELIRRTTLVYQAGSSEKVYEVDLCRTVKIVIWSTSATDAVALP
ncbi:hypothetical protein [Argonema galeatum]|nr:hypothetical protein [Argonema galeatum]